MDARFQLLVKGLFGAESKFEEFLKDEAILTIEDYRLYGKAEDLIEERINKPATAKGIAFATMGEATRPTKLWLLCLDAMKKPAVSSTGVASAMAPLEDGSLPPHVSAPLDTAWAQSYRLKLGPSRVLVGFLQKKLYDCFHTNPPTLPLVAIKRMFPMNSGTG